MGPAALAGCSGAEPSGLSGSGAMVRTVVSTSVSGTGGGAAAGACACASSVFDPSPTDSPASVVPETRIALRREIVIALLLRSYIRDWGLGARDHKQGLGARG